MMMLGPLEYVAIGSQDNRFTDEILPVLNAIQESGAIRVVDLLFVTKDEQGTVTMREVSELSEEDLYPYGGLTGELTGLLTVEDINTLAAEMPAGTSAVIVLLEHTWASGLTEAVQRAGGVLYAGGLVPADALERVRADLAAAAETDG